MTGRSAGDRASFMRNADAAEELLLHLIIANDRKWQNGYLDRTQFVLREKASGGKGEKFLEQKDPGYHHRCSLDLSRDPLYCV